MKTSLNIKVNNEEIDLDSVKDNTQSPSYKIDVMPNKYMREIKDTGMKYTTGEKIFEGDDVIFEFSRSGGGAMSDKVECNVVYKNFAFYLVSKLTMDGKPALEVTIASIIENNAQIPHKHPMYINKVENK